MDRTDIERERDTWDGYDDVMRRIDTETAQAETSALTDEQIHAIYANDDAFEAWMSGESMVKVLAIIGENDR